MALVGASCMMSVCSFWVDGHIIHGMSMVCGEQGVQPIDLQSSKRLEHLARSNCFPPVSDLLEDANSCNRDCNVSLLLSVHRRRNPVTCSRKAASVPVVWHDVCSTSLSRSRDFRMNVQGSTWWLLVCSAKWLKSVAIRARPWFQDVPAAVDSWLQV